MAVTAPTLAIPELFELFGLFGLPKFYRCIYIYTYEYPEHPYTSS